MNYVEFSDGGLLSLHASVQKAKDADDAHGDQPNPPYGVYESPDWVTHASALEQEMSVRGITFDPIDWAAR